MLFKNLRFFWLIITGLFSIYIVSGCSNDTNRPSHLSATPYLDISIYQGDVEAPIGTTVRFKGYLISASKDTLDKERIFFSVYPDTLGTMVPVSGAITDVNNPAGFREGVIFTPLKEGRATILGVYRDAQGLRVAADSVEIKVIGSING